ncbi:MAG TPA: four helix bundle protein [Chthoniobacterales bacterium]|nr:four helix bundle protein [Chthoniobacterales bacterium]
MAKISSFRDLNVYQRGREEARAIFLLTKAFPPEERYSLTDQIRRSSRAVNAMVAEAWAKRRYEAAFVSKINDALGEAMETQAWLDHAADCEYITHTHFKAADDAWQQIGGMLHRMSERSADFCKPLQKQ